MPNFETFYKRSLSAAKEPMVTLQKKGPISLNRAAFVALGEPPAVELLFDPEEGLVGIRGVNPRKSHAYLVRVVGKSTYVVAGGAFRKYYNIQLPVSMRYKAGMYDDVLAFDLRQGVEVTSNRNGKNGTNGHRKAALSGLGR